jgi:hypothetical protein
MIMSTPSRLFQCLVPACALLLAGCGGLGRPTEIQKFQMGQAINLSTTSFTALETDWRATLDGRDGQRFAKNQFLLIKLLITNGGGGEITLPLMTLLDSKNNSYLEEEKGDGVPQWLGLLRVLKPAESEEGFLLFDVQPASYRLRISTGGDPEKEQAVLIDIPYQLDNARPTGSTDLPITPSVKK